MHLPIGNIIGNFLIFKFSVIVSIFNTMTFEWFVKGPISILWNILIKIYPISIKDLLLKKYEK